MRRCPSARYSHLCCVQRSTRLRLQLLALATAQCVYG
jgi:hypothetical protein